jgi:RNA polymerase sigma-70 factor (ECF subfamily)
MSEIMTPILMCTDSPRGYRAHARAPYRATHRATNRATNRATHLLTHRATSRATALPTNFVKAPFSLRKFTRYTGMSQIQRAARGSGARDWSRITATGIDKQCISWRLDSGVSTRMADGHDDWAAWLERHGAALVLLARQWVATHADAEDVVQEGFVRFWRSRRRANDAAAYLFACVRNCARDRQRGEARRSRREEAAAVPEAEPAFAVPLEQAERTAAIEAALASLPEEQREVLVMKIWCGLTFIQIGEALGVAANTAASRYRYSLERLRKELAEEATR